MNTKETETNVELRPLARVLARELSLNELGQISGGWPIFKTGSGQEPYQNDDDHHN